jgi:cell division septation protein DedD
VAAVAEPSAVIEDTSATATDAAAAPVLSSGAKEETAKPAARKEAATKPVARPKAQTAAKTPAKKQKSLGNEPVVLVPPSNGSATAGELADNGIYGELPASSVQTPAVTTEPVKRRRTLVDLLKNQNAANSATAGGATVAAPEQQVASTSPAIAESRSRLPAQSQLKQQPEQSFNAGSSAYVVQLASFRSREEASAEFNRIRARHTSVVNGLTPIVDEALVGGSTRYRLGLGPLSSRAAASQVCSKLFSAGERDCLVRRQ